VWFARTGAVSRVHSFLKEYDIAGSALDGNVKYVRHNGRNIICFDPGARCVGWLEPAATNFDIYHFRSQFNRDER